jgi:hypothetical protein
MLVRAKEGDVLGATVLGMNNGAYTVSLDTMERAILPAHNVNVVPGRVLGNGSKLRVRVTHVHDGRDFASRITVKEMARKRRRPSHGDARKGAGNPLTGAGGSTEVQYSKRTRHVWRADAASSPKATSSAKRRRRSRHGGTVVNMPGLHTLHNF